MASLYHPLSHEQVVAVWSKYKVRMGERLADTNLEGSCLGCHCLYWGWSPCTWQSGGGSQGASTARNTPHWYLRFLKNLFCLREIDVNIWDQNRCQVKNFVFRLVVIPFFLGGVPHLNQSLSSWVSVVVVLRSNFVVVVPIIPIYKLNKWVWSQARTVNQFWWILSKYFSFSFSLFDFVNKILSWLHKTRFIGCWN